jgi:hypothetical protein
MGGSLRADDRTFAAQVRQHVPGSGLTFAQAQIDFDVSVVRAN